MKTNSLILCALLAVIAVAGLMNRAKVREFEDLLQERHAALETVTARVNQLPELREKVAKWERRQLSLFPTSREEALKEDQAFDAWRALQPKLDAPTLLTPYDHRSLTAAQYRQLLELDTAIQRTQTQLPLVVETEMRLGFLKEYVKLQEQQNRTAALPQQEP